MQDKDKSSLTDKRQKKTFLIKGYLRPDGTYYVSIPKDIQKILELGGGEYFSVKAKPEKNKISLRLVELLDEENDNA